jgi:hypothetical protein
MCKPKENSDAAVGTSSTTTKKSVPVAPRPSGLNVTLKKSDSNEKTLEETAMVNRSSFSNLLQRHAQWKSPSQRESSLATAADDQQTGETAQSITKPANLGKLFKDSTKTSQRESDDVVRPLVADLQIERKVIPIAGPSNLMSPPTTLKPVTLEDTPMQTTPINNEPESHSHRQTLPEADVSMNEETLQEVKTPAKDVSTSPSSSSVELSPNLKEFDMDSPPVIRPRNRLHRKRDLVISDSEEEYFPKQAKKLISPKAAMKSAPSSRLVIAKPAPIKLSMVSSSSPIKRPPELARKSAVVAKKSGTKLRVLEPPISRESFDSASKKDKQGGNPQSPILPVQPDICRIPRPPSQLPDERPPDPGESLQYSLRLILTTGSANNDKSLVSSTQPGYDCSSLYPPTSSRVQRPAPASAIKKRSQDKNNFDVLSLVPEAAVPVLEDGKLAFREGAVDGRTGQLKRGARKFKVGRTIPGELL